MVGDFPGGPVVKNPPYNAGDVGSIPGQGTKIPCAAGQLSPCDITTELVCLNQRACMLQTTEPVCSGTHVPQRQSPDVLGPVLHNYRRENLHAIREKPVCHNERSRMPQRRSHIPQLRPDAANKKKKNNNNNNNNVMVKIDIEKDDKFLDLIYSYSVSACS